MYVLELNITNLVIALLVGIFVFFVARSFPATKENNWPWILAVLCGILAYFGAFVITV